MAVLPTSQPKERVLRSSSTRSPPIGMAPSTLSDNGRQKFSGNTVLYVYQYRYRPRVFLPRNINTVLESNGACRRQSKVPLRRSSGAPKGWDSPATRPPQKRRQRMTIDHVLNRLRPDNPVPGSYEESRLKIDVKALKWNPHPSPRQAPSPRTY